MASFLKTIMGSGATALAATAGLAAFTGWKRKRAEQLVPPDGQFADVEGGRLHYLSIGEGAPIVLVHGLGGQLRNFIGVDAGPVFQVHAALPPIKGRGDAGVFFAVAKLGLLCVFGVPDRTSKHAA